MSADRGTKLEKCRCWKCRGDGYYWRVPDGFNPFLAGAMRTAAVSWKVECFECGGTGAIEALTESASSNSVK